MSLCRRVICFSLAFLSVLALGFSFDQLGYVTTGNGNTVVPVDLSASTVGPAISVSDIPFNISITPDGQKAYVASVGGVTVTPINLLTNTPLSLLSFTSTASEVVIAPDGVMAYVIVGDTNGIVPLVVATDTLQPAVTTESGLYSGCLSPDGSKLFVTNLSLEILTVLDTSTKMVQTVPGIPLAFDIACSADGKHLYLATGDSLVEVSTATYEIISTVSIGAGGAARLVLTPDGTKAYVTNTNSYSVTVVDLVNHTVAAVIDIGMFSFGIDISQNGQMVYVGAYTLSRTGFIVPIVTATNAIGTTIPIGEAFPPNIALIKISPVPPKRPDYFLGQAYRIKKHGHHVQYQMRMRWKPSSSENVARYDIYANSEKVTSVSSAAELFYRKYIHPSRKNYYYIHHDYRQHFKAKWEVRAVSGDGSQSPGKHLKVRHDVHR